MQEFFKDSSLRILLLTLLIFKGLAKCPRLLELSVNFDFADYVAYFPNITYLRFGQNCTRYFHGVKRYPNKSFQRLTCPLNKGITKILKELKSQDNFLKAIQDTKESTAQWAGLAELSCRYF